MQHSTSRRSIFCSNTFISHALSHKFISRAMLHPRVKKACETLTCGSELSVSLREVLTFFSADLPADAYELHIDILLVQLSNRPK